eukprot:1143538-Pelagomonas_calceolata.AAC.2
MKKPCLGVYARVLKRQEWEKKKGNFHPTQTGKNHTKVRSSSIADTIAKGMGSVVGLGGSGWARTPGGGSGGKPLSPYPCFHPGGLNSKPEVRLAKLCVKKELMPPKNLSKLSIYSSSGCFICPAMP